MRLHSYILLTGALLVLAAGTSQATISHTWVSSTGSDANACTRSAPCATFAGALAKTSAGGEIDVADAGDYGPVTISQSVSIEAVGVLATIQVTSGNAVTVNAGASDVVVLRGLTLDGQGAASDGVHFSSGGSLYVENCRIHRFNTGIDFLPSGVNAVSSLFVTDTIVRNSGTGTVTTTTGCGVYIQEGTLGFATASIDGLRVENNVCGVKTVDGSAVVIRNSIAASNAFAGFSMVQNSNIPSLLVESSISAHNGTGVLSANVNDHTDGAVVRLSNVTITDNQTGMAVSGTAIPGQIVSFGNNKNNGNSVNGAPTSTIPQM
jgi:hypothetical protein